MKKTTTRYVAVLVFVLFVIGATVAGATYFGSSKVGVLFQNSAAALAGDDAGTY